MTATMPSSSTLRQSIGFRDSVCVRADGSRSRWSMFLMQPTEEKEEPEERRQNKSGGGIGGRRECHQSPRVSYPVTRRRTVSTTITASRRAVSSRAETDVSFRRALSKTSASLACTTHRWPRWRRDDCHRVVVRRAACACFVSRGPQLGCFERNRFFVTFRRESRFHGVFSGTRAAALTRRRNTTRPPCFEPTATPGTVVMVRKERKGRKFLMWKRRDGGDGDDYVRAYIHKE